jgi:release factor glutamine methyltransferase
MLISELVAKASSQLEQAGVSSPQFDAEVIAAHVLEITKSDLQLSVATGEKFPEQKLSAFEQLLQRRISREPLQHLTGIGPFRHLELKVGKGVFTPRFETEQVVEYALGLVGKNNAVIVDLCSGSGAIAISLGTEVPGSVVYAVEKSEAAFPYLIQNFESYGLDSANCRLGDLADELDELIGEVDLVISNPPYIPLTMVPQELEVQLHEPELALYGGEDGLDLIRIISKRALQLLKPGGHLVLEHADTQAKAIGELLLADGWQSIHSRKDLNFRDRMISAQRP